MKRLTATIHGRVQGVGFRWFIARQAARLSLAGWVANDPAGTVSLVAEGTETALNQLIEHVRRGPSGAEVERVDKLLSEASGDFDGFRIRAGGHRGD